jgi:AcrR family transcriptional regulator
MTHNIEQLQLTILEQTLNSILQRGVRAFTIDGLAAELGMSKKTIYKYFPNKENLIENCFMNFTNLLSEKLDDLSRSDPHPVKTFLKSVDTIHKEISRFTPDILKELKIHYPAVWLKIEEFRRKRFTKLMSILKIGQAQGYVDASIDLNIATTLVIEIINTMFQPEFFTEHGLHPADTYKTLLDLVTRGILTEKGKQYV